MRNYTKYLAVAFVTLFFAVNLVVAQPRPSNQTNSTNTTSNNQTGNTNTSRPSNQTNVTNTTAPTCSQRCADGKCTNGICGECKDGFNLNEFGHCIS